MASGLIPLPRPTRPLARASLVLLWLGTAAASLWGLLDAEGRSRLLLQASATPEGWTVPIVLAGAGLDLLLGLALWRWHRRRVYQLAGLAMLGMTVVASVLLPGLWLDPLGSLSKNLPIAALLYLLHQDATR